MHTGSPSSEGKRQRGTSIRILYDSPPTHQDSLSENQGLLSIKCDDVLSLPQIRYQSVYIQDAP
jgi:hypothetical protein